MKQGIGFSVTINIIAVFIVIVFAFLVSTLNYYKAYKVNNVITDSLEKYEGNMSFAKDEISKKLTTLGYVKTKKKCASTRDGNTLVMDTGNEGYCVYKGAFNSKNNTVTYIVYSYISIDIPVINVLLNLPVKSSTNPIFCFNLKCS